MRPRISLRTMFVLTAFAAVFCYWLVLPTVVAERFIRAVATANYERADIYFRNPTDRFLQHWNEKHWRFQARGELETWSFKEFLRGQRVVKLQVSYGDAGPMRTDAWAVTVTRAGLLRPQQVHAGGFGGGGIDTPLIPTAPTS